MQSVEDYADGIRLSRFTTANVPDNLTGTGSPTATDNSVGFVGKFDQMVLGIREEMRIDITRSASDGTDDAFKQLLVMIRTWARMDVALMRPTGFVTINNIGARPRVMSALHLMADIRDVIADVC